MTDGVVRVDELELSMATHRVSAKGIHIDFSPTEFRLLHFFMTHIEQVYSPRAIAGSSVGQACIRRRAHRGCSYTPLASSS